MTSTKVLVEVMVSASSPKVWEFWTGPEHNTNWNFASDDWHCPNAENNLKVGGKFSSRMEAKDGSFGFDFWGIYDEIIDLKKIAYTMGDGRKAITIFEDQGNKTKITTTFDAENENPVEMQRAGWQAILSNFKEYVEITNNES